MAVVFGEKQKDGWLKVTMIQWQLDKHPNGHTVKAEKIPPYPERVPGVGHIQMFNPKTKKWRYDVEKVPLTQDEVLADIAMAIRELATEVRALRGVEVGKKDKATSTKSRKKVIKNKPSNPKNN